MSDTRPVGIFDSGIGGLTVLRRLQKVLPNENFVYFADTAHLPYGEKTAAQIQDYARHTLTWMQEEVGAKLVIAACHTSSATALDGVAPEFDIPVIGTIYPLIDTVLQNPTYSRIGILATPASVKSRMHEKVLIQSGFQGVVQSISCPDFVPLIEAGRLSSPDIENAAKTYLTPFETYALDTLIYGCTHYPWIASVIQSLLPSGVKVIDPAEAISAKAAHHLSQQNRLNSSSKHGTVAFYSSSTPESLAAQIAFLTGIPAPRATLISLPEGLSAFPHQRVANA